ncbi:DUF4339 domain-containing protein [Acinetobacter cumulans]|uniref:GYF domain-containing protein n=1 Tax=Acinetobacter cumulans TaxID=2136182 RepID=UPI0010C17CC1|nr:GYF domain-containing protein [Acinetobacter cumulans]QCO22646.1 DUF4339 domain-containing protein [Acinetobacter cumulans]
MTNMKNDQWYYLDAKHQTLGTYNSQKLLELYQKKIITGRSYVWKDGFDDWKRFEDVRPSLSLFGKKDVAKAASIIQKVSAEYHQSVVDQVLDTPVARVQRVDYTTPYQVVWLSEQHKQHVNNLTEKIVQNLAVQKRLESLRLSPNKPDGLIIGTGEADFTKGNVPYEFTYQDKIFQLIDVPGIEGNEGKYEHFVKQAIEKAHLVIYVNGTNKKPEEKTTRKIKSYINQYAKVYAVCNVRGKADSYEFEEDQVLLTKTHKDISDVLDQTLTVLNQNVGQDLIEGGQCIQGLLAFSALAYDQNKKETTISSSRKDLIKSQKSYMSDFSSLENMKSFSQVNALEEKIISKFATFEEDIIESNKHKIVRKIEESIGVIQEQLDKHLVFQTKIKKELDVGQDSINRLLNDFENNLSNKSNNAISSTFLNIADSGCGVIENYFGDKDAISSRIESIVKVESGQLLERLETIKIEMNQQFSKSLEEAVQRVGRSVEQIQFNFDLEHSKDLVVSNQFSHQSMFDAKSMGKGLMEIGGMAALGASIGMVFPVVGNIVGGLLGAGLGLVKFVIGGLSSKQSKIKKAQSHFRTNVNSAQSDFKSQVRNSIYQMVSVVRQDTEKGIIVKIYSEYEKMQDVERILTAQLQKLRGGPTCLNN